MPRRSCDGAGFLAAFRSAVASLEANVDEINALNVFPVPDGDTGTNMLATVRAALDEADRVGPDADAERVAQAASFGALMGARGNSGVITSQILAGMAHGLAGKRRFNGLDLAHALDAGTKMAYKAVAKPVEGTILTVIREASAAAVAAAERDNDVETVLAATVEAAERAVAKTPVPAADPARGARRGLRRAGPVPPVPGRARGGARPAARRGRGTGHRRSRPSRPGGPDDASTAAPGMFGYETVYLVRARPGQPLDVPAIQAHLESIGDSVLVAGDARLAKVHVHNDRPDAVIAYGISIGMLSRITIENLDSQAQDVREAKAAAFVGGSGGGRATAGGGPVDGGGTATLVSGTDGSMPDPEAGDAPATRLPLGVVAVAPSDGLAAVLTDTAAPFREYGAFRIVRGGQSANPSTGELLEAVESIEADELLILPNNPNVVLAARQVATMTRRPVHVVPTRNCAEGDRGAVRAGSATLRGDERGPDDGGRPVDPDDAGHRGRPRRDRLRPQGEEGPDDRPGPGRRPARRGQRQPAGRPGRARPAGARLRPGHHLLRRGRHARRRREAGAQDPRGRPGTRRRGRSTAASRTTGT